MYLDRENGALARYLEGDRQAADVVSYFKRFELPVQKPRKLSARLTSQFTATDHDVRLPRQSRQLAARLDIRV